MIGTLFLLAGLGLCAAPREAKTAARPPRVLMIVTSHGAMGATGRATGFWLEELAAPYQLFKSRGMDVDIASPRGGRPPIDPESLRDIPDDAARFRDDEHAQAALAATKPLRAIAEAYDAYFVVGGHGVLWDLAEDRDVRSLLSRAFDNGKVVAAVCHGPAALVGVCLGDGAPLVRGRRVTGFSNEEEQAVGLQATVPFALESALSRAGGRYERGAMWAPFALRDGRLVTGQNPASSRLTAEKTIEAMEAAGTEHGLSSARREPPPVARRPRSPR